MAESQAPVKDQAFITLVVNDSHGPGALNLGCSLRRVETTKSMVCMVTKEVSPSTRDKLAHLYDLVEVKNPPCHVNRCDVFSKLYCWRLTQYSKCVFMDASSLVVQNIDDLFEREELSAVPSIVWPNRFNAQLFVFKPSQETYNKLIALALENDHSTAHGLLNTLFSGWLNGDDQFHLPYPYVVMVEAFHTRALSTHFTEVSKDAKVVFFIGSRMPWHGIYHPETGAVDCPKDSRLCVLPKFVNLWWEIFTQDANLGKNYLEEVGAAAKRR